MGFKIIMGKMGSGKSYYGAEVGWKAFGEGAIVHSNLHFRYEEIIKAGYDDIFVPFSDDPATWKANLKAGIEGQENVVVIDEGAIIFNTQDWQKAREQKREVFELMVHARHLGLDVFFITQHPKNVDVQLRRMCESMVQCVNARKIPAFGWLISALRGDFIRYSTDNTGKTVFDTEYVRFDPAIGAIYKTHTNHGTIGGIERDIRRRTKGDDQATRSKRKVGRWVTVTALLALGGFAGLRNSWGRMTAPKDTGAAVAAVQAATPAGVIDQAPPKPKYERYSMKWPDARGRLHIDLPTKEEIYLGGFFREGIVKRLDRHGECFTVVTDAGLVVKLRPTIAADRVPYAGPFQVPEQQTENPSWNKKSQLPSASSAASSPASSAPSPLSLQGVLSKSLEKSTK